MEAYLTDLSSLLLLGILLGCHYLGFRNPARSNLGRALQRAGKVRMLAVSVLAPLSVFLWLEGHSPLLTLVVNQILLYWVGSTLIEVAWILRRSQGDGRSQRDWRPLLRLLWLAGLSAHAGWQEPNYRDLAYALAATGLLALLLLKLHRRLFRARLSHQKLARTLQRRLVYHGYLLVVGLSAYYLLRAWTVVPITSGHLHALEQVLWLLLGLAAIETVVASVDHLVRLQRHSEETALLATDAIRAVLYSGLALLIATQFTTQDVTSLALSSAFFSVGLGFALKPTLGNFVSGLVQSLSRDFFIGDFVNIGPIFGLVTRIDWRTVSLGTLTHDTITIPHSTVAASVLINYTRPYPWHGCYLELQLSRSIPPGMVRKQLLDLLKTIPEVSQQPAPEVYLMDLTGFASRYRIRWWLHHINHRVEYESAVHSQLAYGLERLGMRPTQPIRRLDGLG